MPAFHPLATNNRLLTQSAPPKGPELKKSNGLKVI
jgi:hypothetical protein